ncbi:MAG: polysaccharide deacetylase family protein [Oscillospiraceae bacterium]
MRAITWTKRKIKNIAIGASLAAATLAVGIGFVITSVSSQAAARKLPIYRVERGDNKIALTFDVAWENSNTDDLIKILGEFNAPSTFFITGDWCDRYPEDVKKFYDAGHEIQNHSDQHPHVEGINVNDLITDTREASRKIKMITGVEPTLYRAPYGEYDDSALTTLEGMGMKVIQWDVDSIDWKEPTPEEIKARVLKGVKSGSIVLFHNDLENTTEALPQILTQLKNDGYEFVTVSDLIYPDNYTIDANGEQQPVSQSSLVITPENVEQVLAQNSDLLTQAGFTDEQVSAAVAAVKGGEIPEDIAAMLSEYGIETALIVNDDPEADTQPDDPEAGAPPHDEITDTEVPDLETPDDGSVSIESKPETPAK